MKTRIKSFLERRRQLIESMSAPIVLTLVVLLVIASSISANTTNQQQQQQQAGSLSSMSNMVGPKSLPLQSGGSQEAQMSPEAAGLQSANSAQPADGQPGQSAPAASTSSAPLQSGAPARLPRINIFASKSEVRKLLGIDTSINYVTNGQLNLYPLGFTIPMGYHLSDMIFTWQNLGATNVNYSISLIIGNLKAVERPLINITRSGLIPRHEQVFKITLPCSGKLTDDVDVQVLINISGLVPLVEERESGPGAGANSEAAGEGADSEAESLSSADWQLARALHQQQNELMSANLINQTAEQMQADESARRPAAMRQVSHTIAIKRKKICTQHPVPVTPAPRPAPVWPPNQAPPSASADSSKFQPTASSSSTTSTTTTSATTTTTTTSSSNSQAGSITQLATNSNQQAASKQQVERHSVSAPTQQAQAQAQPANRPSFQWQVGGGEPARPEPPAHQPAWSVAPAGAQQQASAPRLEAPQAGPASRVAPASLWPPGASSPRPTDSSLDLLDFLHPRLQPNELASGAETQQPPPQVGALNPILFTLLLMALIISTALVALLAIGTASSSSALRRHPLDKLNALTNCLFRRRASSRAPGKCTKGARSPVISSSTLVVGPNLTIKQAGFGAAFNTHSRAHHATLGAAATNKSALSSLTRLSGLSTDSGPHQQQQQQHSKQQTGLYYYAKQQHQQQQQQQQQQTAAAASANYSPYYHHYQCPPDLLIGNYNSATTSPYHITMSNQQTTKLFLGANGNTGYAVDNNYTITPPTTLGHNHQTQQQQQQARSDSGSVYQTIY